MQQARTRIHFKPYGKGDLPIPFPWDVDSSGRVLNKSVAGFDVRVTDVVDSTLSYTLNGLEGVFEQPVIKIEELV